MSRTAVALTTDNNTVSVDKQEWGVNEKRNPVIRVVVSSRHGRTRMIYMRKGEALRLSEALFDAAVK